MTPKEIQQIQEYVKSRYEAVNVDYKTAKLKIDTDLSYDVIKNLIDEELKKILPLTKEEEQEKE